MDAVGPFDAVVAGCATRRPTASDTGTPCPRRPRARTLGVKLPIVRGGISVDDASAMAGRSVSLVEGDVVENPIVRVSQPRLVTVVGGRAYDGSLPKTPASTAALASGLPYPVIGSPAAAVMAVQVGAPLAAAPAQTPMARIHPKA